MYFTLNAQKNALSDYLQPLIYQNYHLADENDHKNSTGVKKKNSVLGLHSNVSVGSAHVCSMELILGWISTGAVENKRVACGIPKAAY